MSPRRAENPNAFQEAKYLVEDMMVEPTVENRQLFEAVDRLEQIGTRYLGEHLITAKVLGRAMHAVYIGMADIEIVPPLDEEQKALVAGKVATFAAMAEIAQPKSPKKPKPTDTNKVTTNDRK